VCWLWQFLVFFVLLSMLIPMSLFVSIEVVRVLQVRTLSCKGRRESSVVTALEGQAWT